MSDLNSIFGYQVYKPPPETDLPVIEDLNVHGELVTLIDPSADVIQDPAVQKIFKSMDGERTVKIEDLPPDVRYDGWNKKALYDKYIVARNMGKANVQPQAPIVGQNLLKQTANNQNAQQELLKQAQQKAERAINHEQKLVRHLQDTRLTLEKDIHKQLVEQLTIRAQRGSVTPDQQALIEKLYLDLRLINPELALATIKASAEIEGIDPHKLQQPILRTSENNPNEKQLPPQLYHNQGSIMNHYDDDEVVAAPPKTSSRSKSSSKPAPQQQPPQPAASRSSHRK